ncbi:MAG TPA: ABC transporter permease [Acidimicrobiia bacterium]
MEPATSGKATVAGRLTAPASSRQLLAWAIPIAVVAFASLVWPFPAPIGIVLFGVLEGGRIALLAIGIALVYRANRVINFAAGDLGQVPGVLALLLVLDLGWNYYIGAVVGLIAAIVVGVLVETLIIRRFFKAPRLILTVATIGVSQLLTVIALRMPGWNIFGEQIFGTLDFQPTLTPPFHIDFGLGQQVFHANDVLTLVLVPLCLGGLALFLRHSSVGYGIRAAAERADRASTLGVPVKRLHTIVWVIAAVLSYVAVFLQAGGVGLPIGMVVSPTLLIAALGAAVVGRFERLPTITFAAIGIGILDQVMTFQPNNKPAYNDLMLFAVVLVALLLTRRPSFTRSGEVSTWQAVRESRPIPPELAQLPEVKYANWALGAIVVLFLVTLPLWLSEAQINLASVVIIFAIIGISLVVLTGWAGQVSLGQMAFAGVGAAVGGALTANHGWDLSLALLVGGVIGAVIAVIIGYPAIRRRGFTLAVSTLAFALVMSEYFLNRNYFESLLPGIRIERPDLFGVIDIHTETRYYFFCLVCLALMYFCAKGIRKSRTGRALVAIRENENAARAYGINATRTTMAAFAISGFMAAFAGVLFVHQQSGLGSAPFLPVESLTAFAMVVIGGLGSLAGALIGAFYVRGAEYFLPGNWALLATSLGLLLVLFVAPGGVGAALADARDAYLRWVANRRGILVPSLVADRRADDDHALSTAESSVAASANAAASPNGSAAAADAAPVAAADDPAVTEPTT